MKKPRSKPRSTTAILAAPLALAPFAAGDAYAQDAGPAPDAGSAGDTAVAVPGAGATTTTTGVYGLPSQGFDPDAHLPRGSRAVDDINASGDGFDLNRVESQPSTMKGGEKGQYVLDGASVPPAHTVRRGDTLWGIAGQHYRSPYQWPKVWSYNPQILNPHWIYPGDRVRLRDETKPIRGDASGIADETVFLRDVGWIDDPEKDAWGELVGAPGEHMMLGHEENVYVQLDDDKNVKIGDKLQVFRPVESSKGGELVSVKGTIRIDRYNPETGMAKGRIIESIDVIERGNLVGPVKRQFHMVSPVASDRDLDAHVIAALYPHVVWGDHQILFIDKGKEDGVVPGMRFFAIEREDKWVESLSTTTDMARTRARQDIDPPARFDMIPTGGPREDYPDETYAELRIVTVRDQTALAVVTASVHEIERGARLVAKKGF
jgi:hypothetical protein